MRTMSLTSVRGEELLPGNETDEYFRQLRMLWEKVDERKKWQKEIIYAKNSFKKSEKDFKKVDKRKAELILRFLKPYSNFEVI